MNIYYSAFKPTYMYVYHMLLNVFCYLLKMISDYGKRIVSKAVRLCEDGVKEAWKAYPVLSKNLGPLTARVEHPVKETAVKEFVSRFSKSVMPVARPPGTEGLVVEDETAKKMKRKKEERKQKKKKKQQKEKEKRKKQKDAKKKKAKRTEQKAKKKKATKKQKETGHPSA